MGIIETLVVMLFAGAICGNLKGGGLSKKTIKPYVKPYSGMTDSEKKHKAFLERLAESHRYDDMG